MEHLCLLTYLRPYLISLKATGRSSVSLYFLPHYGDKILSRYPDEELCYHGGQTRVLAVDRSISFSELLAKRGGLCGSSVSLKCQLPTEDLDALVSITFDEDLINLIEEYDQQATQQSKSLKIRAFLWLPKRLPPSPSPSTASASGSSSSTSTATHEAGLPKSPLSSPSYSSRDFRSPPQIAASIISKNYRLGIQSATTNMPESSRIRLTEDLADITSFIIATIGNNSSRSGSTFGSSNGRISNQTRKKTLNPVQVLFLSNRERSGRERK